MPIIVWIAWNAEVNIGVRAGIWEFKSWTSSKSHSNWTLNATQLWNLEVFSQKHTSSKKAIIAKLPQTLPTTMGHVLKWPRLWGISHSNHHILFLGPHGSHCFLMQNALSPTLKVFIAFQFQHCLKVETIFY